MQKKDYLPIEYLFNLLSICRKRIDGRSLDYQKLLLSRGLRSIKEGNASASPSIPRISFWIHLAQATSLLSEEPTPYPTLLVEEWLSWGYVEQMALLLNGWLQAPKTKKIRDMRRKLLTSLKNGDQPGVSQSREMSGLQVLGICETNNLTALGVTLLRGGNQEDFTDEPPECWRIKNNCLLVPFPPDWKLLWDLETFIDPVESGIYPVESTDRGTDVLRYATQRKVLQSEPSLKDILERGLGKKVPDEILAQLKLEPTIRILPGTVLEFAEPEELKKLRKTAAMRRVLGHLLSPRHVVIEPLAIHKVLKNLQQRGLLAYQDIIAAESAGVQPAATNTNGKFNKAELAFLLCAVMMIRELKNDFCLPPGLVRKLTIDFDATLWISVARKAERNNQAIISKICGGVQQQAPQNESTKSDQKISKPSQTDLVQALETAINRQETISVLYQKSGHHIAEYRQLTPLLVESRQNKNYLIAYCHLRRANRTFRLDRLELIHPIGAGISK